MSVENKKYSTVAQSIYVSDDMPADGKMITDSFTSFDSLPDKCKWDGMLVYVKSVAEWHKYKQATDTLEPFGGGGGSGNSSLIVPNGKKIIWKYPNNLDNENIELNDIIEGFIENKFIKGKYTGGNEALLTSYDVLEETNLNI